MEEKKIKGLKVKHKKFGEGNIVEFKDAYVSVKFISDATKKFPYPDAFEKFLTTEDDNIMSEISEDLSARQQDDDYAGRKRTSELYTTMRKFDEQKMAEAEMKKQQQIEKQRQSQRMRLQKMREMQEKNENKSKKFNF